MSEFGIYAKEVLALTTAPVAKYGKIMKIPCSIGFRQQDKSYVNEWFNVIVFERGFEKVQLVEKGDKLKVSGRVQLTEWENKDNKKIKQWSILADDVEVVNKQDVAF